METDREEEAMKVLKKLHYNGHNEAEVEAEFHEIKITIAAEKAITVPSWSIMFTVPQWRTRLMHGVAVQVFTQFTGISKWHHRFSLSRVSDKSQTSSVTIRPVCTQRLASLDSESFS